MAARRALPCRLGWNNGRQNQRPEWNLPLPALDGWSNANPQGSAAALTGHLPCCSSGSPCCEIGFRRAAWARIPMATARPSTVPPGRLTGSFRLPGLSAQIICLRRVAEFAAICAWTVCESIGARSQGPFELFPPGDGAYSGIRPIKTSASRLLNVTLSLSFSP